MIHFKRINSALVYSRATGHVYTTRTTTHIVVLFIFTERSKFMRRGGGGGRKSFFFLFITLRGGLTREGIVTISAAKSESIPAIRSGTPPPSPPRWRRGTGTPRPLTSGSLWGGCCRCWRTCSPRGRPSGCPCPPSCASPCGSGTRSSPASPTGSNRWRSRFCAVATDTCWWRTRAPAPGAACS